VSRADASRAEAAISFMCDADGSDEWSGPRGDGDDDVSRTWLGAIADEEGRGAMLGEVVVRQVAENGRPKVVESRSEENRKHERNR